MRSRPHFLHTIDAPCRLAAIQIASLPADRWQAIEALMAAGAAFDVVRIAHDAALIAPSAAMQALIDGDALPPETKPETRTDEEPAFIPEMETIHADAR